MYRLQGVFRVALVLGAVSVAALPGCGPGSEEARDDGGSESAEAAAGPQFGDVRLFVNNYRLGDTHGCDGGFGVTGQMKCGPSGGPALVTWRFLRREGGKDVYEMKRVFPVDGVGPQDAVPRAGSTQIEKAFAYSGGVLVLMEDDAQRVILYPAKTPRPPSVGATTARAP